VGFFPRLPFLFFPCASLIYLHVTSVTERSDPKVMCLDARSFTVLLLIAMSRDHRSILDTTETARQFPASLK
jgi:hypothetical protein